MSRINYTKEQKDQALELKRSGSSNEDIAEKTGLKLSSVNRMFPRPKPENFSGENPHLVASRSWERRQSIVKDIGNLAEDDKRELLKQLVGAN